MKNVFKLKDIGGLEEYTLIRMKEYHDEVKKFKDIFCSHRFLCFILWYLLKYRNSQEHCIYSVINVLHISLGKRSLRFTAFYRMLKECVEEHQDSYLNGIEDLLDQINANTIEELLDFLEYDICREEAAAQDTETLLCLGKIEIIKLQMYSQKLKGAGQDYSVFLKYFTPEKIKYYLDEYVIGQEEAKKIISVAVYSHYKRICYPNQKLNKTNVLMIGPTGCGKTEIIRALTRIINVPVVLTDVSGLVATPYKGRNKEDILLELYQKAKGNLAVAEKGIVFLDEFDKLIKPVYSKTQNINDEMQAQMLGLFEGTEVELKVNNEKIIMNTSNILFICAGAFEGLEGDDEGNKNKRPFGFHAGEDEKEKTDRDPDFDVVNSLIRYGMKPELAGRIGEIVFLKLLTKEELLDIMTEPENSIINQYKKEFMYIDQVELEFEDEVLEDIAEQVTNMKIGARGISTILNDILQEALFEIPGSNIKKVVVVKDRQNGEIRVEKRESSKNV